MKQFTVAVIAAAPLAADSPCDVDGSGVVDINDLLDLLANWGPCP